MNNLSICGLVLAAGFSSRMKQFKPLMKINDKSFIQTVVEKSITVCDKIIVVTGFNSELIANHIAGFSPQLLSRIILANNSQFERGMFSSLQTGLKFCLDSDWVLYHFVDQPVLPIEFYKNFIAQIDNKYNWIQPKYNERKGHPLLLSRDTVNKVLDAPETSTLRELKINFPNQKLWNCKYNEIFYDFDTPQNLEEYILSI